MRWGMAGSEVGRRHAMEQDAHDMHEVGWMQCKVDGTHARWMGHIQVDGMHARWMGCMQGGWDSHEVGEGRQKMGGIMQLRAGCHYT